MCNANTVINTKNVTNMENILEICKIIIKPYTLALKMIIIGKNWDVEI